MGEYVVAQGTGRGTHRGQFNSPAGLLAPSGRAMEVSFCDVYKLRDCKILRANSNSDFYDLWKQLTAYYISPEELLPKADSWRGHTPSGRASTRRGVS